MTNEATCPRAGPERTLQLVSICNSLKTGVRYGHLLSKGLVYLSKTSSRLFAQARVDLRVFATIHRFLLTELMLA